MERQPGMSRETTDSERSVLFAQVCICVCVSASSTLPAREWLWDWNVVPVRAFFFFFKSETHWHFKHTGDISVAALLCSHFTTKLRSQTSPKLFSLFQMFPPIFFIKNHDFHWNWQMESLWISTTAKTLPLGPLLRGGLEHIKTSGSTVAYGRFCVIPTLVVLNPHKSIRASVRLCQMQGSHKCQWNEKIASWKVPKTSFWHGHCIIYDLSSWVYTVKGNSCAFTCRTISSKWQAGKE